MFSLFNRPWSDVDTIWIDTETTGISPAVDRAVEVALVRFEAGKPVAEFSSRVNPGRPIPAEATVIHGIDDAAVKGAPTIAEVFEMAEVKRLLEGAWPGSYNASFDKLFVPPFGEEHSHPWLDALSIVRVADRWVRGTGRHKLSAVCERHGIDLVGAHGALADARAAGQVFYRLAPEQLAGRTLVEALRWQRHQEADSWADFWTWKSRQPPREVAP